MRKYPHWTIIKNDIHTLHTSGVWPSCMVPDWAYEVAKELHCGITSKAVIEHGLMEIIRQLEIEITTHKNTIKKYIKAVGNAEGVYFIPNSIAGTDFTEVELSILRHLSK